jgi:molecular chaperone DnaK (HSP70)
MTIELQEFRILAVTGGIHLSGRDFDVKLSDYCLDQFDPNVRLSSL